LRDEIYTLPVIIGDGDTPVQAFTNLVETALKYTAQEGEMLVLGRDAIGSELVLVKERGSRIAPEDFLALL